MNGAVVAGGHRVAERSASASETNESSGFFNTLRLGDSLCNNAVNFGVGISGSTSARSMIWCTLDEWLHPGSHSIPPSPRRQYPLIGIL